MSRLWSRWWLAACTLGLSAVAGAAAAGEAEHLRLTVVFDNVGARSGLVPGWGFACLVEAADTTLLLDTGADGAVLLANMQRLGHRAEALDAVVLSHIHADHTGGLAAVLAAKPGLDVWLPATFPAAFQREVVQRGARVQAAMQATGRPIHLLIGGFHLLHADAAQVEQVIKRLQGLGVERVAPSHCTGAAAIAHFRRAWGKRFIEGGLGAVLEVPLK